MTELSLNEKQLLFPKLLGELFDYIYKQPGLQCKIDQAQRPTEVAEIYARQGKGIKNSQHTKHLACDILLFRDGKYLVDSRDYAMIGIYWESLSGDGYKCTWGGRFNDGDHFSIEHNGVK